MYISYAKVKHIMMRQKIDYKNVDKNRDNYTHTHTNTMDLTQSKLTKSEWENIESPVSDAEKTVLQ